MTHYKGDTDCFKIMSRRARFLKRFFTDQERPYNSDNAKIHRIDEAIDELRSSLKDYYGPLIAENIYWEVLEK